MKIAPLPMKHLRLLDYVVLTGIGFFRATPAVKWSPIFLVLFTGRPLFVASFDKILGEM